MKEYTETDPKRIEELLAVPIGAETLFVEHLEQFKKIGLQVVAYELEDIPKLISKELPFVLGLTKTDKNGGKTWFCFTPEAKEVWDNDRKAQEFKYWETINKKVDGSKNYFLKVLQKSPNPAETIADRIRQGKWRLNPDSDPNAVRELGLNPNSHLKEPWRMLKLGNRQFDNHFHNHWQIKAEVENKFLEWLIEYQKKGQPNVLNLQEQRIHDCDLIAMQATGYRGIVEYFNNPEGAEVQLSRHGNSHFIEEIKKDEADLEAAKHKTDGIPTLWRIGGQLEAHFIPEALPQELERLLEAKFKDVGLARGFKTKAKFAAIHLKELKQQWQWQQLADRFPIAEQWLDYLKDVSEPKQQHPAAPIVTLRKMLRERFDDSELPEFMQKPPQAKKGGTEAENGVKLTQRQAAYFLAYNNEGIRDPRSDTQKLADKWAKKLCKNYSATTGAQVYSKFDKLRSDKQRQQVFNSELDRYTNRDSDTRAMKAILSDIKTIVPLLTGKAKTDAENDLSDWNTMYSNAIE
jgi:hypothetical protein